MIHSEFLVIFNQELEKFRFVLDYKIKELKQQIVPREAEIAAMRKQIEEMDLELEQYHKSNQALKMMISELELKSEGLRGELRTQEERVKANALVQTRIQRDLAELSAVLKDKTQLKARFVQLFRQYAQADAAHDAKGGSIGEDDPRVLYNRDREQMERNLESVRRALKTDATAHRRDFEKMMRENVVLTRELNELRQEHHEMLLQKAAVDSATAKGLARVDIGALMDVLGIGAPVATARKEAKAQPPKTETVISRAASLPAADAGLWREVAMQNTQMQRLEADLKVICESTGAAFEVVLRQIDEELLSLFRTGSGGLPVSR